MAGCNCGSKKSGGTGQKFLLLDGSGSLVKVYSSETDARMAASKNPGYRVRPA
jgi:hypothetical protein